MARAATIAIGIAAVNIADQPEDFQPPPAPAIQIKGELPSFNVSLTELSKFSWPILPKAPEVITFRKDVFSEKLGPKIYEEVMRRRHERYASDPEFKQGVNFALAENRINILVTGVAIRERDPQTGKIEEDPLTDSIQMLSYHIPSNTLHIVSIPRDLQSPEMLRKTRDARNSRINQALAEGGVELLREALENMTSLPIDFYLHANSDVLKDFINRTVGTIEITLEQELRDDQYPTEDYGTKRIYYPKGVNVLNGEQAVEVARARHGKDDYDRSQRQQKVIQAFLGKFLEGGNLLDKFNKLGMAITANNLWYEKIARGDLGPDFDLDSLFFDALKKELSAIPAFIGGVKIAEMPTIFSAGITNRNFVGGGVLAGTFITKLPGNPYSLNPRRDYYFPTRRFIEQFLTQNTGEPPQEEEIKVVLPPKEQGIT